MNTLPIQLKAIIENDDDFKDEICAIYKTPSGKTAMVIRIHANERFSYIGTYGAGSGHDFEIMQRFVETMIFCHKKTRLVEGFDFLMKKV